MDEYKYLKPAVEAWKAHGGADTNQPSDSNLKFKVLEEIVENDIQVCVVEGRKDRGREDRGREERGWEKREREQLGGE